ncbi:MAG: hypothetical protein G01um101438_718 [Parcubacteria group bacterium Gr01-1014_38]|nr:MAG: hypothetical protein G01um101438_718 [Parcubacteria group bacterium Gr01-1014_38]
MSSALKKVLGIVLILLGLLALLTPLTPGSWLIIVGAELLGFRLLFLAPLRKWFSRFPWSARPSPTLTLAGDPRTRRLLWGAGLAFGMVVFFVLFASWRVRQQTSRASPAPWFPPVISTLSAACLLVGSHALTVELARTPSEQARGLSGRDTLGPDRGMLFVFPTNGERVFWMKDTRIPLDFLWIREGKIVGITANVQPEPGVPDALLRKYISPGPVDQVLEVNAGWSATHDIRVRDPVRFPDGEEMPAEGGDRR